MRRAIKDSIATNKVYSQGESLQRPMKERLRAPDKQYQGNHCRRENVVSFRMNGRSEFRDLCVGIESKERKRRRRRERGMKETDMDCVFLMYGEEDTSALFAFWVFLPEKGKLKRKKQI